MCDSTESIRLDQEISNRLQNEHPEQFVTLVRMHLSFELDLNTDTENDPTTIEKVKVKKWKGFHKKARGCTATKATSPETAKTVLTKQNIRDVMQLIDFLVQDKNISQEGIFRKTGSLQRQNELKNALIHGIPINLEKGDYTAHDCASVLKSFLADLSEPLLTEHYYPAYCQVADFCHSKDSAVFREERLLHAIQLLVLLLPKENNRLLESIIDMLYRTVQHEPTNKMSADNLATLFTPHLICPRKLSPEALHATAQQMCSIISFMIKTGPRLFHIPPKLAIDIRAYFVERKRRKTMSPEHILNESVTSDSVANTVYTFVDREKTAEAHVMNSTDTALAQLYAHIQSLPESSKKKKLIKQFNRENGHGTPLQVLMLREKNSVGSSAKVAKSIGDSIKRHIFHKNLISKTPKRNSHTPVSLQESIMTPRSRKPVMLLAGMNATDHQHSTFVSQTSFSSLREEDEEDTAEAPSDSYFQVENNLKITPQQADIPTGTDSGLDQNSGIGESSTADCLTGPVSANEEGSSLTSTFRNYLLSRSVMTDSPADLSFFSQPDDFDSDAELEEFSESKMSDSLLFCMNGNRPDNFGETDAQQSHAQSGGDENIGKSGSTLPEEREQLDETSL